jgi:protein-disulfide isomerase
MKKDALVPIAIIVGGLIVAIAVYVTFAPLGASQEVPTINPAALRALDSEDHILGNPHAKAIVVVYSDFECPYCKNFDTAVRQVLTDYGPAGDIAFIFRNFALTELHANAKRHAEAAECVARTAGNEAYWSFSELLFKNQPANPLAYSEYARAAGAAPQAVASCLQNTATNGVGARVDSDRENALLLGARGAPFSLLVVSGKTPVVLEGAWSYQDLNDTLREVLETP